MDDELEPGAAALEAALGQARIEQDLLWSVVALVRRSRCRPAQVRLDALLAGEPDGPIGLVPTVVGQREPASRAEVLRPQA